MSPELIITIVNSIIIFIAYIFIYPKHCGSNIIKIGNYDLFVSASAIAVAGYLFWGQGYEFNLLFFSANWFWFSLIVYFLIEVPVLIWYSKKHKVKFFEE